MATFKLDFIDSIMVIADGGGVYYYDSSGPCDPYPIKEGLYEPFDGLKIEGVDSSSVRSKNYSSQLSIRLNGNLSSSIPSGFKITSGRIIVNIYTVLYLFDSAFSPGIPAALEAEWFLNNSSMGTATLIEYDDDPAHNPIGHGYVGTLKSRVLNPTELSSNLLHVSVWEIKVTNPLGGPFLRADAFSVEGDYIIQSFSYSVSFDGVNVRILDGENTLGTVPKVTLTYQDANFEPIVQDVDDSAFTTHTPGEIVFPAPTLPDGTLVTVIADSTLIGDFQTTEDPDPEPPPEGGMFIWPDPEGDETPDGEPGPSYSLASTGGIDLGGAAQSPVFILNPSGIYTLVKNKRHDTLYERMTEITSVDVKIPDPFVRTGFIGE